MDLKLCQGEWSANRGSCAIGIKGTYNNLIFSTQAMRWPLNKNSNDFVHFVLNGKLYFFHLVFVYSNVV